MNSVGWKHFALVLAVALAVRLAAVPVWQGRLAAQPQRFLFGDSESYWTLGMTIAQGQPYRCGEEQARVFRTPGYPLLLAPLFGLAEDQPPVVWARVQSAVFGALAVAGVWWLAWLLFDGRTAAIAGVIAALYPGAVAMSVLVLSEAPFCALMTVQLALWTLAWRAPSISRAGLLAALAGLVAGAATLVRPSWLLFTPMAAVAAILIAGRGVETPSPQPSPKGRGRQAWIGAAMLAGLIVAMAPWWIRNYRVTGRFVPTTLQVGASLLDGWNPKATGASDMSVVPKTLDAHRLPAAEGDHEYELDRHCRSLALDWARAHPLRVAQLAGVKVLRTWNLWPNEPGLSSWPVRIAVCCTYLPVLVLAVVGAGRTIRLGWPYILCWLPALYFTLLHAVFVGSIRYRQPAMFGLIVLAAGVVAARGRPRIKDEG